MKQTGELLKQAREGAKLSLSEVALATKINPKILNAIEVGDMTNLPAKTFLKGFVRSYALYLKMDADEVMKVFHSETGSTPAPQINVDVIRQSNEASAAAREEKAPKRRVTDEESFSGLRAIAVVVIVVLIGLIIGVRELIEKYKKETVVADTEIKVSPLSSAVKEEPVKEVKKPEPTPAPVAAAAAPAQPEPAEEEPAKEEAVPEIEARQETPASLRMPVEVKVAETKPPEPKPEEVKPATPPPAPAPVAAPTATPAAAATPVEAKPAAILKQAKHEIILEALDKVEVKFQVSGQTKKLSLAPSQVHTIFADGPMVLDVSDGGAVNIILNGRDKGPAGDLGKPKQVKVP